MRSENSQYINIIHTHTRIHTWYILQPQFIWPYKKPMVHFRLINVIVFCHVYFVQMLYINGIHYSCPDPTPLWPLCTRDFLIFKNHLKQTTFGIVKIESSPPRSWLLIFLHIFTLHSTCKQNLYFTQHSYMYTAKNYDGFI